MKVIAKKREDVWIVTWQPDRINLRRPTEKVEKIGFRFPVIDLIRLN
jgi:hypothetical protein